MTIRTVIPRKDPFSVGSLDNWAIIQTFVCERAEERLAANIQG